MPVRCPKCNHIFTNGVNGGICVDGHIHGNTFTSLTRYTCDKCDFTFDVYEIYVHERKAMVLEDGNKPWPSKRIENYTADNKICPYCQSRSTSVIFNQLNDDETTNEDSNLVGNVKFYECRNCGGEYAIEDVYVLNRRDPKYDTDVNEKPVRSRSVKPKSEPKVKSKSVKTKPVKKKTTRRK